MSTEKSTLKRSLGLFDATSIVAGSMIGSGIFIVSAYMARDVGSAGYLILLWLVTGLITLAAALSYGELAGMMPQAGGQYVYIQRAFGKMPAFLYGWTVFTVIQTGVIAAVAVAFANYSSVFFPGLNNIILEIGTYKLSWVPLVAIVSILLLTWINNNGVDGGRNVQRVFTSAKVFALFALIILGLVIGAETGFLEINFSNAWEASRTYQDESGSWITEGLTGLMLMGILGSTIINSLFSSDAWNNVTFIAGEIKDPKRNIPRSLFLGTLIVTALYILANLAYLVLLPLNGNPDSADVVVSGIMFAPDNRVGASAAYMIFGDSSLYIMAGLIMISTFGCNNGIILSGARLYYAMAKDGLFFKKAAELNSKQVPSFGLWTQCAWASVLCLSGQYNNLLTYATFASLLFYVLTIWGLFVLRKKEPLTERPYKAFGYPLVPALYILVTGLICIDLLIFKTMDCGLGLLIVALGVPVFFLKTMRRTG